MAEFLTPSSTLKLLRGVNLTPSYSTTFNFSDEAAQRNYFLSKEFKAFNDYTVIRTEKLIRINVNIEDIIQCNYVMYKNKNKWVYAFITDKVYINDNVTGLRLKTDVFQTYMFDYTLGECFVIREHKVPLDKTLLDEGFNLGTEYKQRAKQNCFTKENAWLVILSAPTHRKIVKDGKTDTNGLPIEVIDIRTSGLGTTTIQGTPTQLLYVPVTEGAVLNSLLDTLKGCTCLLNVVKLNKFPQYETIQVDIPYIDKDLKEQVISVPVIKNITSTEITKALSNPSSFIDDERFNCYPYSYSLLTDYVSTPLMIKHEYLNGATFGLRQSISHEPVTRYYIKDYCGDTNGNVHNVTTSTTISLPLASDQASLYMANNKNQLSEQYDYNKMQSLMSIGTGIAMAGAGVISAVATGGLSIPIAMGIGGGVMSATKGATGGDHNIKSLMAKTQDIANMPPSIRTMGRVGNEVAFNINNVDLITYSIDDRIKERISGYWDAYGYQCLERKIPQFNYRSDFDYIKTDGCSVETDSMTVSDILELENIFNSGVTIKHK